MGGTWAFRCYKISELKFVEGQGITGCFWMVGHLFPIIYSYNKLGVGGERERGKTHTSAHARASGSILKQEIRAGALPSDRLGQGKLVPRHRSPMISSRRPSSSQWPGQTAASSRVWGEQTEEAKGGGGAAEKHKHITVNLPHPPPPVKTVFGLDRFNFFFFLE